MKFKCPTHKTNTCKCKNRYIGYLMLYLSGVDQWWGTRRETMRFTAINSDKTYNMLPEDFYTCVQHGQVYSQGEGLELNMSGNFWKCKYGFLRPGDSIN